MKAIYERHYLTDQDVANFARQSFADLAENFTEAQNNNLIRYLARGMQTKEWDRLLFQMVDCVSTQDAHRIATYMRSIPEHWVPFGHPSISIRMEAPVPMARQLFKHKIGFVESEESRRYISSRPVLFIPDTFRSSAANVKQGSAGDHPQSDRWKAVYRNLAEDMINKYEMMIADGVCAEQARLILPQGCEVHWVWTGSLYAYAQMAVKRLDSHTQKETRDLIKQVDAIIEPLFPVSWPALTRGAYYLAQDHKQSCIALRK